MEVRNLLDISTREELYLWYQDNHDKVSDFWLRVNRASADCRRLIKLGEMTPSGLAALQRFIAACHAGKMQPGWSDFGRLEED